MTKAEWFERLEEDLGLDPEDVMEIAALFFETMTVDKQKFASALATRDDEVLIRIAHSFKGAAANLLFEDVVELARDIEQKVPGCSAEILAADFLCLEELIVKRAAWVGID